MKSLPSATRRADGQPVGTTQAITFAAATNSIGLAVTSKVNATVCTAVFDQFGSTVKLGVERTGTLSLADGPASPAA